MSKLPPECAFPGPDLRAAIGYGQSGETSDLERLLTVDGVWLVPLEISRRCLLTYAAPFLNCKGTLDPPLSYQACAELHKRQAALAVRVRQVLDIR